MRYKSPARVKSCTAYYNGALSAVKWKTSSALSGANTNQRSYKFAYDKLMRLKDANYADRSGGGSWGAVGNFDEKDITYDMNGNILTLKRNAVLSGSAVNVDDLSYSYNGNRLDNVTDGSGGSYALFGFRNLTGSATAYSYDDNGNMTADAKKGLTLSYNELNRTKRITITTATNRYIDYTYDSGGTLLRKQAYDNSTLVKTTDYIGGFTYEDGTLAYFGMSEGRVRNASGTLTNEYFIKDHQGNVRVSFEDNGGTALVRQENSFYPYGLTMPGSALPSADNKKLYNGGSEWQNDFADLPDLQQTFYRNYDPALGRFVGVDPVAESAESMTTYQYALNNPGMLNDPMGDQVQAIQEQMEQAQAVNFNGGYRRLEGNYNDAVDQVIEANKKGPFSDLWDLFYNIANGGGENAIDITLSRNPEEWDLSIDGTYEALAQKFGRSVEDTHKQELAKYGTIIKGGSFLIGGGVLAQGLIFELGEVETDKGWHQLYKTVYSLKTTVSISASKGDFMVVNKPGKKTAFSDWKGPVTALAIGVAYVGIGYSYSETYETYGFAYGLSANLPKIGTGIWMRGNTTLIGKPYYVDRKITREIDSQW